MTRSTRLLSLAKLRAHGFDDVDGGQAPADMCLVPLGDLRRRDADHAHFEPPRRSGLVDKRALDHDRRRKPGRAIAFADVAADDRKARLRISALERLEAVVEIVVPKRRDRVVKRIHGGDDRMDRARVRSASLERRDRRAACLEERRRCRTTGSWEPRCAPARRETRRARGRLNRPGSHGNNRKDRDWRAGR